jgi:hypothetical protein
MSDSENTSNDEANNELSGITENQNAKSVSSGSTENTQSTKSSSESHSSGDDWKDEEIKRLRKENAQRRLRENESKAQADEAGKIAYEARETLNALKEFKESVSKDLKDMREKTMAAEKRAISAQLESEARKHGVADMELFKNIIDHSALKVADGNVTNVDEVIKNVKQKHPVLFDNRKSVNTGSFNQPKPTVETRKDLTGLSKKDYAKARQAHMRSISANH